MDWFLILSSSAYRSSFYEPSLWFSSTSLTSSVSITALCMWSSLVASAFFFDIFGGLGTSWLAYLALTLSSSTASDAGICITRDGLDRECWTLA